MCGIVAVFSPDGALDLRSLPLAQMRDSMRHRGPDAAGELFLDEGRLWFGHRRLAVIDRRDVGTQPMAYASERYWLIFNGEIYNHHALRTELESLGHRFRSRTDTEVILAAYAEWGARCVERFNGMWAFALWDGVKRELFISRDRMGVKPLYIARVGSTWLIASELRAILASRLVAASARPDVIAGYLTLGLVDGYRDTCVQGIERFPAAHTGTFRRGELQLERFWQLPDERAHAQDQTPVEPEALHELLRDAVRLRLIADVPVGIALSGGLDSSAIYALAAQQQPTPVWAFTARFPAYAGFDESAFARAVVERHPGEHHFIEPSNERWLDDLPSILWHLEEPSKAMGVLPQWHVMRYASQHVTVLLDGQGGDEVWAGYDPYANDRIAELARRRAGKALLRELVQLRAKLDARTLLKHALRALPRGQELQALLQQGPWARNASTRDCVRAELQQLSPERLAADSGARDLLNQRLAADVQRDMLPALLRYEDKLGMAFSLEARTPFLDYRIVELAFSLPSDSKYAQGWSKLLVRKAMQPDLPSEVCWRRDKQGFPTPTRHWLRGPSYHEVRARLLDARVADAYLDRRHVERLLTRHHLGEVDAEWTLWRLLSFVTWLQLLPELSRSPARSASAA